MFKLFKSKKKSKKEKESKKDQNKENIENKEKNASEADDKKGVKKQEELQHLSVDTSPQTNQVNNCDTTNNNLNSCQVSPSVLSDSHNESTQHHDHNNSTDHHHHYSLKTSELNATFSGADLNRVLTSGYITGDEDMGYLKHGVNLKSPKSPHFHRPPNFSYSNHPSLNVSHQHRKTNNGLLTSTLSSITTVKKIRHYSTSPTRSIESEEAIRLSRLPGGYIPDPEVPKKIESLDWPSPPYPAAVPELRSRSRSTSNRRGVELNNTDKDDVDSAARHTKADTDVKTSTKVYRKIYDNQHDDYLLRFKRNKNEEVENEDDEEIVVDEKLKRDLEEISKFENKSGIAKIIAKELKAQEKSNVVRPLDPWKASRTPNANLEPHQKTRFDSPVNASPSRVICSYKSSNVSQNLYEDGLCSTSAISTSTIHKDGVTPTATASTLLCSTPRKGNTLQKTTTVPKPGYGLSSPRATTLPNSSRYTDMSTHKSVDFDSFGAIATNCYSEHNDINNTNDKIKLNNNINAYIHSRNAHATRSTPNLIGTPKIYKYADLKIRHKKKLPPDVDRERLERHLASDEFSQIFGVTLEEFYELPEWKRVELKKRAKLF